MIQRYLKYHEVQFENYNEYLIDKCISLHYQTAPANH